METTLSVLMILSAILAGAVSPGPSFVLVARVAMGTSRKDGVATSIGMGVGGVLFSGISLMGLHALLTNIPILYLTLKVLGGLYLVYLGIKIWMGAKQPLILQENSACSESRIQESFLAGFITQVSNPKTAIVYGSIFAALLPTSVPTTIFFILPPLVFLVEAGWYLIVTFLLSSPSPQAAYIRSKSLIDRIAGTAMAGLGIKLMASAGDQ